MPLIGTFGTDCGAARYCPPSYTDPVPIASNLNHTANQTIANAVIVPVDPNGEICFDTESPAYLIADINGWYAS